MSVQGTEIVSCVLIRQLVWGELMKEEILHAAIRASKRHGLKFTMDDIVRDLHISKSSLYGVVGSKEGLIKELVSMVMEQYSLEEKKILQSDITVLEKLQQLFTAYSTAFSKYNDSIFRDLQTFFPESWKLWLAFQNEKVETVIILLKQGMAEGNVRDVPAEIIQCCMQACVKAVNDYNFLERNNISYSDAVSYSLDMMFNGLKNK